MCATAPQTTPRAHRDVVVLKLGGSVLRGERDLPRAVSEVYRCWREGARVVAVVSALGPTTDELLARAEQLGLPTRSPAFPAYLGCGELLAASLLTLALHRAGLPATLLDPASAGLRTAGDRRDAEPVGLDRERLEAELAAHAIVVVPGFVGRCENGHPTLLGRGGSDLTALFLAAELRAECVLLKDVGGLFTGDPAGTTDADGAPAPPVRRFATVGWATARGIAGGAVQDKALRFAAQRGLAFTVRSPGATEGTRVGALADRLCPSPAPQGPPPLRVALLGCGTVGGGVLRHLLDRPERYTVAGVAVRDPSRRVTEVPAHLLMTADALVSSLPDVLVEAAGGLAVEPWLCGALRSGIDVVTANKALLATRGGALREAARAGGARLLSSAAVGGALPAIECVRRLAPRGVRALRAVLNGTSTFVLDQLAKGEELAAAVAAARELGFAEADPRLDLDGTDAAQKLTLLLDEAFPGWSALPVRIRGIDAALEARVHARGGTWRLVAQANCNGGEVEARVGVRRLRRDDFLARSTGAGCALEVLLADGDVVRLGAQGAGRWPTAEAVLAALEDLRLDPRRTPAARSRRVPRAMRATREAIAEPLERKKQPRTALAAELTAGGGEP